MTRRDRNERKEATEAVVRWARAKQAYRARRAAATGEGHVADDRVVAALIVEETEAEAALLALGTRLLERSRK